MGQATGTLLMASGGQKTDVRPGAPIIWGHETPRLAPEAAANGSGQLLPGAEGHVPTSD